MHRFSSDQPMTPKEKGDQLYAMIRRNKSIRDIDFSYANIRGKKLPNGQFDYGQMHHSDFFQTDLRGSSLTFADISDSNMQRSLLSKANFHHAILTRTKFDSSNLNQAHLCFANLTQAKLHRSKLLGTDLRFANLEFADLSGADLRWADLRGAHLKQTQYRNASRIGAQIDLQTIENSNWHDAIIAEWKNAGATITEAHTPIESLVSGLWLSFPQPHERLSWWLNTTIQLVNLSATLKQITATKWVFESADAVDDWAAIMTAIAKNNPHPQVMQIQNRIHPDEWQNWQTFFAIDTQIAIWENGRQIS